VVDVDIVVEVGVDEVGMDDAAAVAVVVVATVDATVAVVAVVVGVVVAAKTRIRLMYCLAGCWMPGVADNHGRNASG